MLSRQEWRWAVDPRRFEESHGANYSHVIRHRIRRKVGMALEELEQLTRTAPETFDREDWLLIQSLIYGLEHLWP